MTGIFFPGERAILYFAPCGLLKEATGVRRGIRIFIEKKIPIGSGLGGPSSNAATVLKELCSRWDLGIDHRRTERHREPDRGGCPPFP